MADQKELPKEEDGPHEERQLTSEDRGGTVEQLCCAELGERFQNNVESRTCASFFKRCRFSRYRVFFNRSGGGGGCIPPDLLGQGQWAVGERLEGEWREQGQRGRGVVEG